MTEYVTLSILDIREFDTRDVAKAALADGKRIRIIDKHFKGGLTAIPVRWLYVCSYVELNGIVYKDRSGTAPRPAD